jgi:hypothetical protein
VPRHAFAAAHPVKALEHLSGGICARGMARALRLARDLGLVHPICADSKEQDN